MPRQRCSKHPNLDKKTAEHDVYAACTETREDRFQVSYDRICIGASQDIIIATLNDDDLLLPTTAVIVVVMGYT
jgi:hypothetical protein